MSLPHRSRRAGWLLLASLGITLCAQAEDLAAVYVRALDGNPEYLSALAAYQQAIEAKPQALAKLLPQIGINGQAALAQQTASGQYFVDTVTPNSAGVNVDRSDTFYSLGYAIGISQVVFHRDLWLNLDQAELEISRAGIATLEAQNQLRLDVAKAYFDQLAAADELRYALAQKEAIAQVLSQTQGKAASGILAPSDVDVAQAQLDLSEAEVVAARNGVAVSQAVLDLQVGNGVHLGALKPLAEGYVPQPVEPHRLEDWMERAKVQNLGVQSKLLAAQIARKELDKAYGQRWPRVDAGASRTYSFADGGLSRGIGTTNNHESDERVGMQVKLPIFTGGAIQSGIRAATAGIARADADADAARGIALRNVQLAYLGADSGIALVAALKQGVASARTSEEAIRVGYEVGTRTSAELLIAVRNRYKAERDYARSRYDFLLNTLRLRAAAGTLNHSDFLAINLLLQ